MISEWLRNDRERKKAKKHIHQRNKRRNGSKKSEKRERDSLDEATEVIFERERDGQNE